MAVGTKDRANQTVRDLVISMFVVGLFVAFLYLIVLRPTPDPVREVDVSGPVGVAAASEVFDVLVPVGLPDGWRATSARLTPGPEEGTGTWFNGYVNPNGEFVAVVQQDFDLESFLAEQTDDGTLEGNVSVSGDTWQRYYSPTTGERSIVLSGPEVTTVVTGTVPYEELEQFAALLRTA